MCHQLPHIRDLDDREDNMAMQCPQNNICIHQTHKLWTSSNFTDSKPS